MQPDQPTPDQLASFDQTHAALVENLDDMAAVYRSMLADGEHPDISLAGLGEWLVQASGLDHVGMAEHLAVAVRRLHDGLADVDAAYKRGEAAGAVIGYENGRADELRDSEALDRGKAEGRREAVQVAAACTACGKAHDCRPRDAEDPTRGVTWADPNDGHSYSSLLPLHHVDRLRGALTGGSDA